MRGLSTLSLQRIMYPIIEIIQSNRIRLFPEFVSEVFVKGLLSSDHLTIGIITGSASCNRIFCIAAVCTTTEMRSAVKELWNSLFRYLASVSPYLMVSTILPTLLPQK